LVSCINAVQRYCYSIFQGSVVLIFQYQNENTGDTIELDFPFGKAPPSTIKECGEIYRRVYGVPNVIYGASFHNEGQIKFKRPPLEAEGFDYT
jgi:hypothetical protein